MKTDLVSKKDDGALFTTSLLIEQEFGMKHKNVLAKINKTMNSENPIISEFGGLNFKPVRYIDAKGESRPMYEMTEEGFAELVMGMTGDKAKMCRIAFLNEFVKMRDYIKTMSQSDAEMLRITRINPNTLKAITGERSNNAVRENYKALIDAGLLEAHTKTIYKRVYLPTEKGLDYVKTSHHDIMRFKPKYHELIIEAVGEYREKLSCDNADLFLEI